MPWLIGRLFSAVFILGLIAGVRVAYFIHSMQDF